jgi:hypothetical protein
MTPEQKLDRLERIARLIYSRPWCVRFGSLGGYYASGVHALKRKCSTLNLDVKAKKNYVAFLHDVVLAL